MQRGEILVQRVAPAAEEPQGRGVGGQHPAQGPVRLAEQGITQPDGGRGPEFVVLADAVDGQDDVFVRQFGRIDGGGGVNGGKG